MSTVTYVSRASAYARSNGASSINISFPATPTVGNRAVVVAHQWSSGTKGINVPTDNQGGSNTYAEHIEASDGGNQRTAISSAEIVAASGTFTVTQTFASSSWCAVMLLEYSGVDHSSPTVGTAQGSGTGTSVATSTSVTPVSADDMILGAMSHEGTNQTMTPTNGGSTRVEIESGTGGQPSSISEEQSTGAQTVTFTLSTSQSWIVAAAVLRAVAASADPFKLPELSLPAVMARY